MSVLETVRDISKEEVDTRMLKANILAIMTSAFVALAIFLVYYMIKDYVECITLAVLSSMALRPIKSWSLLKVQELAGRREWFTGVQNAWVVTAITSSWRLIRGRRGPIAREMQTETWRPDGCAVSILCFALYIGVAKFKPRTALTIFLFLLLADLCIRFLIDLFSLIINFFGWGSQNNAHKAEACSSLLSLIVLFCALTTAFSLVLGVMIPTGLEIKDQGSDIIAKVQGLGFNFTTESITATVTKYVENAGGLKAWIGVEETISLVSNQTESAVVDYMRSMEELPVVGQTVQMSLKWLETQLSAWGIPLHHAIDLVAENINEISFYGLQVGSVVWSAMLSSTTSIFSSFVDFVYCACLYLSLVFFLLTRESSILYSIISIIPIGEEMKRKIEFDLSTNVVQIFTTIIKVSIAYALSTYILFDSLDLPLKHTAAMLTGLVGFVQLLDPWMVTLPWVGSLLLSKMYAKAVSVAVVEYFVLGYFYKDIYSHTVTGINVTILTLSSVFGLSNFGVLGVLYGPLIAGLINVVVTAMKGVNGAKS